MHHQSISGEHSGSPVPFVAQVRPAIAVGEPSPRRKGSLVMIEIFRGPKCKTQGLLCRAYSPVLMQGRMKTDSY
jgi:hypothetical protein